MRTAALAVSIYSYNVWVLIGWFAVLAAFFLVSFVLSLLNIIIFARLFKLLARLDARLIGRRSREP